MPFIEKKEDLVDCEYDMEDGDENFVWEDLIGDKKSRWNDREKEANGRRSKF